jgi:hypothetical protein
MSEFYTYAVDWEVERPLPLWQLTGSHQLRVDVTKQFDAKYRIAALRELHESESNNLKLLMGRGTIPSTTCGQTGYKGNCEEIFKHVSSPGDGWGWYVTNNSQEFPGWRHAVTQYPATVIPGESLSLATMPHPKDGYTVQFYNVPWGIFNRYWRRPINLNKQFHTAKWKHRWGKSHGHALGYPAVGVLHFNTKLLHRHKCIIADFARMGVAKNDEEIAQWMTRYARQFRVLSDQESPFVKEDAELCFTMEWM